MNTERKLALLRQAMDKKGISAVIIPSNDPHQSEYMAAHWQARQWITGFTGSAGTAVVTQSHAILWTDFRYWIQAESQMEGFDLFKQGETKVPEFDKWLCQTLKPGDKIALDGSLVAASDVKKYKTLFNKSRLCLDNKIDLISDLWTDRPPMPASQAFIFPDTYAGQTRLEKISKIQKAMAEQGADIHLMTALDDIAWTFNLRGADVHTNPVNLAFALISLDQIRLFIDPGKVDDTVQKTLEQDGIILDPYEDIHASLGRLDDKTCLLINPETVSDKLVSAVNPRATVIEKKNPAARLKAIKNETEKKHIRETAIKDGRAVVNFLYWLEHEKEAVSEISAAKKLKGFRQAQDDYINDSFDAIMAFGPHSAMCHYSATKETDSVLDSDGMFLTDSGGNYLSGTTDITRTLHMGNPTSQEIRDYTLVLKGHIAVATSLFPAGTRGYQVDTLARQFLWQQGMDFGHGTGHGVGFFLCVHEGPARISPHPVDVALKKGMLLTNEPGLYREGQYGIRLENMILVDEAEKNQFGQFLKFENITLCHFEKTLMDKDLLTQEEILWVNTFHEQVYDRLSPELTPEVRGWLRAKTSSL